MKNKNRYVYEYKQNGYYIFDNAHLNQYNFPTVVHNIGPLTFSEAVKLSKKMNGAESGKYTLRAAVGKRLSPTMGQHIKLVAEKRERYGVGLWRVVDRRETRIVENFVQFKKEYENKGYQIHTEVYYPKGYDEYCKRMTVGRYVTRTDNEQRLKNLVEDKRNELLALFNTKPKKKLKKITMKKYQEICKRDWENDQKTIWNKAVGKQVQASVNQLYRLGSKIYEVQKYSGISSVPNYFKAKDLHFLEIPNVDFCVFSTYSGYLISKIDKKLQTNFYGQKYYELRGDYFGLVHAGMGKYGFATEKEAINCYLFTHGLRYNDPKVNKPIPTTDNELKKYVKDKYNLVLNERRFKKLKEDIAWDTKRDLAITDKNVCKFNYYVWEYNIGRFFEHWSKIIKKENQLGTQKKSITPAFSFSATSPALSVSGFAKGTSKKLKTIKIVKTALKTGKFRVRVFVENKLIISKELPNEKQAIHFIYNYEKGIKNKQNYRIKEITDYRNA